MVEYVVDFTDANDFWSFYRAIITGLDFPDWCGRNADAIWDMLTGHMKYPDVIRFKGFNSLPKGLDDLKQKTIRVFERAADLSDDEHFEFIIES